ncbi:MAG: HepT-like ribonuclease domain-containing protein [Rhodospirillales bacterium]
MTRDPILYLDDMINHAREAHRFVASMTPGAFEADTRTQYAVKYALNVVGEAAGKVPPAIRDHFAHVPWPQIIAMRPASHLRCRTKG